MGIYFSQLREFVKVISIFIYNFRFLLKIGEFSLIVIAMVKISSPENAGSVHLAN